MAIFLSTGIHTEVTATQVSHRHKRSSSLLNASLGCSLITYLSYTLDIYNFNFVVSYNN